MFLTFFRFTIVWEVVVVALLLHLNYSVHGFPSYKHQIPNGNRVTCPPGTPPPNTGASQSWGCVDSAPSTGEDSAVTRICRGVGHATCRGGDFPLNPFGADFKAQNFKWTRKLCELDSDGDGFTNGEELGDPCCLWDSWDAPSTYTAHFIPSHPGIASAVPGVGSGEESGTNLVIFHNATSMTCNNMYVRINMLSTA